METKGIYCPRCWDFLYRRVEEDEQSCTCGHISTEGRRLNASVYIPKSSGFLRRDWEEGGSLGRLSPTYRPGEVLILSQDLGYLQAHDFRHRKDQLIPERSQVIVVGVAWKKESRGHWAARDRLYEYTIVSWRFYHTGAVDSKQLGESLC